MKIKIKLFLLFFFIFIPAFSGCTQKETPKKVSLLKRSAVTPDLKDNARVFSLPFGFNLRLGLTEDVRIYTPFLEYLEEATGKGLRIKFTEKYEDTVENLGKGVVQFALIDSLSYVIGREKYGHNIEYLASGVNHEGDAKYRAVIFTRPESDIHSIEDIKNRSFAFGPRMSTQGHLIPRKMLEDAGILLKGLDHYVYTGSHINTVRAVLNGEYDAGGVQDTLAHRMAAGGKIRILKISKPYPSSIIAYNGSADKTTVEAVRSALLAFEPDKKHKDMLADWNRTEMPLGFITVGESEFYKIAVLARRYGLLTQ
jgi:phosphonate transport system substrate-binding protein